MSGRPRPSRAATAIVALLAAVAVPAGDDELLYYVDGDRIVFTNTPSRSDARPVPGLAERVRSVSDRLPATPYDRFIERVAHQNSLDPDLIKAVALVESGFDPRAVSPKGALGLMQLLPETARRYGVADPLDPYESLAAGSRHLRDLLDEFAGDTTLALAAYNAGPGAVRKYGGVPDYRETRDYVHKVRTKLDRGARGGGRGPAAGDRGGTIVVHRSEDGSLVISN